MDIMIRTACDAENEQLTLVEDAEETDAAGCEVIGVRINGHWLYDPHYLQENREQPDADVTVIGVAIPEPPPENARKKEAAFIFHWRAWLIFVGIVWLVIQWAR